MKNDFNENEINEINNIFKRENLIIDMIFNADIITDSEKLAPFYKLLFFTLNDEDFNTYNNILKYFKLSIASEVIMVGLLRLSYTKMDEINEWKTFLNKVEIELNKRNLDSKKILIGLI